MRRRPVVFTSGNARTTTLQLLCLSACVRACSCVFVREYVRLASVSFSSHTLFLYIGVCMCMLFMSGFYFLASMHVLPCVFRVHSEDYIECESCNEWYHFSCEGLDEDNPPDVYSCKRCRQLAAKGQKVSAQERRRNKTKTNEYMCQMVRHRERNGRRRSTGWRRRTLEL